MTLNRPLGRLASQSFHRVNGHDSPPGRGDHTHRVPPGTALPQILRARTFLNFSSWRHWHSGEVSRFVIVDFFRGFLKRILLNYGWTPIPPIRILDVSWRGGSRWWQGSSFARVQGLWSKAAAVIALLVHWSVLLWHRRVFTLQRRGAERLRCRRAKRLWRRRLPGCHTAGC